MDTLEQAIGSILSQQPSRVLLSAPKGGPWRRATFTCAAAGWQAERLSETQAFHGTVAPQALAGELAELMTGGLTQLTAFAPQAEYSLRLTKKGKVLTGRKALPGGQAGSANSPDGQEITPDGQVGAAHGVPATHDRKKHYLLPEGTVVPPLVDIGVMTAEGKVVAAMRDKYRQINRFVELVDDALPKDPAQLPSPLRVVDFGCGKSYLSFILYYYLTVIRGVETELTGLDLKTDVVAHCNAAAQKYGYGGLRFEVGDIADYAGAAPPHIVVTLHACDTATDLALAKAVGWGAQMIFSVPCCQHELNGQLHSEELALLARYGIVKERTAALMTDAIRANLLAASGYKAQLVEFVGFEHTPKNIMIRAVRRSLPKSARQKYLDEVNRLNAAFGFAPTLQRLLAESGALPNAT
ncbi:SAM-dependent methyltransferase [Ruminococcaceae bacterium OttesenSCG-928-D13]|nr:SAM-dependent methyltransferase [Ruminococcaceae bacterium OttesenSCG-928-D13]